MGRYDSLAEIALLIISNSYGNTVKGSTSERASVFVCVKLPYVVLEDTKHEQLTL